MSSLRARLSPAPAPDDFDPEFYRLYHPDVSDIADPARLARHYTLFGRAEGRPPNPEAALAILQKADGDLPPGFDPALYRASYPDLRDLKFDWQASVHFLRYGRREGRPMARFDPDLYRALYFADQPISDADLARDYEEIGRARGRIGSGATFSKARGLKGGAWIDALSFDEFALLNWSWAGDLPDKVAAIEAMLAEGIDRLAPLAFDLQFEPVYYRERRPALASLDDAQLYRRWLFDGLEHDEPGSAEQHLRRLNLALKRYPIGFDWRRYAAAHTRAAGGRWKALDHLLSKTVASGAHVPVTGPEAQDFLIALAASQALQNDAGALSLYDQAAALAALPVEARQNRADIDFRSGRWREALDGYLQATRRPDADVWSFCNAARSALKLGEPDHAFQVLVEGRDRVVGNPAWRAVLREAIGAEFEIAWDKAKALYAQEAREQADAVLAQAVQRTQERWALDALGLPLPPAPDGRILVLANTDLRQCTHYRVEQKEELFETAGLAYEIYAASDVDAFISALPGAAAAIFYRLPAMPMNVRAIEIARALGVTTYYDIDDQIFDATAYPEPLETYDASVTPEFYHMLQQGVPLFRACMALCDYGIASTTALARHMQPVVRTGQVFVLPNGLDSRNLKFLEAKPERVRRDDEVVIVYGSGTKAHNADFLDLAGPALLQVMAAHPEVSLRVIGHLTLDERFEPFRSRITMIGWAPDIAAYWSMLAEADINIAVLAPYATTDVKSEIKWLEAAALGIPSIVSATDRYCEVLEDGQDALIASTPQDWAIALERLVGDPQARASIAAAAKAKAERLYSLEANAAALTALLQPALNALAAQPLPAGRKKRVLLLNIFFPPQTIGGSTRVTRDNLDSFLKLDGGEDFQFAVVTSDNDAQPAYRLRVEDYRGCPVFRISTPMQPNMEWRPFDPEMKALFARILQIWKPDLVHFHCVQRLTGSVVEACAEAGIPYINTLHDAWWLSDYHFLVDMQGRLQTPCDPLPLNPPPPVSVGESLERRRRLRPLLEGSAAILGVSRTFTETYRACGFDGAVALPNGVPPLQPTDRIPSASGRVRLAHVGSQTRHKGYHLVEAALKQGQFDNLELVVVDHSRYGGREEEATWGTTPVRFVGKTPQERMHELYAGLDVLLAPSIWPESFGLVSREALAAGLWVLASDRGAMGEDVIPGVNGWVIDVSTIGPLMQALGEIDADPQRFLRPPPAPTFPQRTADDQARDLLAIYAEVLAEGPRPGPIKAAPARPSRPLSDRRGDTGCRTDPRSSR